MKKGDLSPILVNIGFGNVVAASKVVAIVTPGSAPMKRLREEAKKTGRLIDATEGRRTRSIIVTDSNHIILSEYRQGLLPSGSLRERKILQAKKSRGSLFVVSAPSGAGKTTLCTNVLSFMPNLYFSVSYTTRQPRPGEINDRDYTFISREDFKSMTEEGEFVEWAEVHGELYGTSRNRIETLMDSGRDVILDIDPGGPADKRTIPGRHLYICTPTLIRRIKNKA